MRSIAILALLPAALAHFTLNYPPSLGTFNEDEEGESPCGGQEIVLSDNDTSITVGGFQVAGTSTHPQANWLFRATLSTAEPYNWTNILPVVSQSGLGDFCVTNLTLPAEFVGQQGIIQVSQSATDGSLYQCAAVNFVEGSTSSWPEQCVNASSVTATLTTETSLDDDDDTSSASGTATDSSASATASAGLAVRQVAGGLLAMLPAGLLLL